MYRDCPICGNSKDPRAEMCRACRHLQPSPLAGRHELGRVARTLDEQLTRLLATARRTEQGCLIPTLVKPTNSGYVRIGYEGRHDLLHRLVFDDIPDGMTVDHQCHNIDHSCPGGPTCIHRACFEVRHLFLRAVGDNWRLGRQGAPVARRALTHCPNGHPYEGSNLRAGDHRLCKACHRARGAGRDPAAEPTYL